MSIELDFKALLFQCEVAHEKELHSLRVENRALRTKLHSIQDAAQRLAPKVQPALSQQATPFIRPLLLEDTPIASPPPELLAHELEVQGQESDGLDDDRMCLSLPQASYGSFADVKSIAQQITEALDLLRALATQQDAMRRSFQLRQSQSKSSTRQWASASDASSGDRGSRKRDIKPVKQKRCSVQTHHPDRTHNIFQRIVFHHYFEHLSAALIVGHSLVIGSYVHYACAISYPVHPLLKLANSAFICIFIGEVLLKILAERTAYIFGAERLWNGFDLLLVSSVVLDIGVALSGATTSASRTMFRTLIKICEMMRTARILSIFKVLRLSYALSQIIAVVLSSAKTVLWLVVLLCTLLFVVAVAFTQAAGDYLDKAQFGQDPLDETEASVYVQFGSVSRSSYSIFKAITGGENWGIAGDVIYECGLLYEAIFIGFVMLCSLVIFNIFVGIFVDAAMQSSTKERGLIAQRQHKTQEKLAESLREVFMDLDADGSGALCLEEFLEMLQDEEVMHYMQALKLDISDPILLFKLLDSDATGEVQIENLVQNCMKMKGDARNIDLHHLIYENRRAIKLWNDFLKSMMTT